MSDLLSAASLLLAVVGFLFSLWYGENQTLSADIPTHKDDRTAVRRRTTSAFWSKALPLVLTSVPAALIFSPRGLSIVFNTIHAVRQDFGAAVRSYDAVQTAFCYIVLLIGSVGLYSCILAIGLLVKLRKINK